MHCMESKPIKPPTPSPSTVSKRAEMELGVERWVKGIDGKGGHDDDGGSSFLLGVVPLCYCLATVC